MLLLIFLYIFLLYPGVNNVKSFAFIFYFIKLILLAN